MAGVVAMVNQSRRRVIAVVQRTRQPWTRPTSDLTTGLRGVSPRSYKPGQNVARVTAVDRGAFLVRNQDGETRAELAGKLRSAVESVVDLPCVGDWVCVQHHETGGPAVIHGVIPRKTHSAGSARASLWISR